MRRTPTRCGCASPRARRPASSPSASAPRSRRFGSTARPAAAACAATRRNALAWCRSCSTARGSSHASPCSRRTVKRKLHELAHARAGDKGDTLTLALIAYREEDYELLRAKVTAKAVKQHLGGIVLGEVRRYELPGLGALQFVCERALDTGVTTSLAIDPHGKTLSYALLEMSIET